MAARGAHQFADGTVDGDRIAGRLDAEEVKSSRAIRDKAAAEIHLGLFDHLFFSHRSAEGGHALALEHFKLRPILDLDLRLGEGTGAALAMNLIDSALDLLNNMATFESADVSGKIQ